MTPTQYLHLHLYCSGLEILSFSDIPIYTQRGGGVVSNTPFTVYSLGGPMYVIDTVLFYFYNSSEMNESIKYV
jgi:hypothetical protein